MLDAKKWTRELIEKHSLDMRQFIDFRQSTLANGMRIVEAYNGTGLNFTILPDRGLDIWTAHYKGMPLTWISQGSPFPPDSGHGWLRQFNGGLLVTCGLTHHGPPEVDAETGEHRDLHGLYTFMRAQNVSVNAVGWRGNDYLLELTGTVAEAKLFSEQLRLTRRYTLSLTKPVIEIEDTVVNVGDLPSPFMILYHINPGFPVVSAGARLHTPSVGVYPRDDRARPGQSRWAEYDAPSPRYAEQVFWHHVKAGKDGMTEVALLHDDFGFSIAWDTSTLPYLTQWKNTREGVYVCGVEPGSAIPEGRNAAKAQGRLKTLEPGEKLSFYNRMTVIDGAQAVNACKRRIDKLQADGAPAANCKLDDFAK